MRGEPAFDVRAHQHSVDARAASSENRPVRHVSTAGPAYVVRREDDFDFLAAEYAELHAGAGGAAFQHGSWLHRLYGTLAPHRAATPCVVTVRDPAHDRLVAVLPLVRRRRGPAVVVEYADLGVSDYARPVVSPEYADTFTADASLATQIRQSLGAFDLFLVQRVPDAPASLISLVAGARFRPHHYGTHTVDLPPGAEQWRDQLDPRFVRHLERKYKRLRPKGGCQLRLVTDPDEVDGVMARLRAFRAVRFGERGAVDLVQDPACYEFYRAVAHDGVVGAGPARLSVLEVGDQLAAVALDLDETEGEVFLLVGYDLRTLRNYSLGLLIVDQLAHAAVRRGKSYLDLTVGDEAYKADFGARRRDLFEVHLARTTLGAAVYAGHVGYRYARRSAKRAVLSWRAVQPGLRSSLQRRVLRRSVQGGD